MTLQDFAVKKPSLFWSTEDRKNLSDEVIVETVLEYGEFSDVRKIIEILGRERVAEIFFKKISRPRHNFSPKIENYFKLYFRDTKTRF